ncbi:hypothetical protein ACJ6WD_40500 [Streptomyces sp. VTCC 41912]|uniref:hypothetical protein n=1 Tax=Streptomyces sp. VTCC 41912 TaxID=3383243 RepID=UPI003896CAA5
MITVNPRWELLLAFLPLVLGRLRLVAAVAGGAWLVGIELSVLARVGLLLMAIAVIALDVVLTPFLPRTESADDPARRTA